MDLRSSRIERPLTVDDVRAITLVLERDEKRYSDDQPRDDHGRWTDGGGGGGGGIPGRPGTTRLPPAPGQSPIPEGAIRLYHFTGTGANTYADAEKQLASICEHGILESKATGYEAPPNMVWASTTMPDPRNHLFVEFYAYPKEIGINGPDPWRTAAEIDEWKKGDHDVVMKSDVPPERIVAAHQPWHEDYRFMEKAHDYYVKQLRENPGQFDSFKESDPQTYRAVLQFMADNDIPNDPEKGIGTLSGRLDEAAEAATEYRYAPDQPRDEAGRWAPDEHSHVEVDIKTGKPQVVTHTHVGLPGHSHRDTANISITSPSMKTKAEAAAALKNFTKLMEHRFAEDQPRVPAGEPGGGQWTSDGGGAGAAQYTRANLNAKQLARLEETLRDHSPVGPITVEHMVRTLSTLYEKTTPQERAEGKDWYPSAHRLAAQWSKRYGVDADRVEAAIAATSPQANWPMNKLLAERVLFIANNPAKVTVDDGWMDKAKAMGAWDEAQHPRDENGRFIAVALKDMSPEFLSTSPAFLGLGSNVEKAIRIVRGAEIDKNLGGDKARSFFANIHDPQHSNEVTMDRHAVRALLNKMPKTSDEVKRFDQFLDRRGVYEAMADAYREAAAKVHLTPSEFQAVIWVHWRQQPGNLLYGKT